MSRSAEQTRPQDPFEDGHPRVLCRLGFVGFVSCCPMGGRSSNRSCGALALLLFYSGGHGGRHGHCRGGRFSHDPPNSRQNPILACLLDLMPSFSQIRRSIFCYVRKTTIEVQRSNLFAALSRTPVPTRGMGWLSAEAEGGAREREKRTTLLLLTK